MRTDSLLLALSISLCCYGCREANPRAAASAGQGINPAAEVLERVRDKYAPDSHLAIFEVGSEFRGTELVLTGEVSQAEAKAAVLEAFRNVGWRGKDEIRVLPAADLGEKDWGLITLSVASGREEPNQKAEMGTQALMGQAVRILKAGRHWCRVQTSDRYLSWMEAGAIVRCTKQQVEDWNSSPLLIVTNFEERVLEKAAADAESVSDVVMGDLVKKDGEQ